MRTKYMVEFWRDRETLGIYSVSYAVGEEPHHGNKSRREDEYLGEARVSLEDPEELGIFRRDGWKECVSTVFAERGVVGYTIMGARPPGRVIATCDGWVATRLESGAVALVFRG